MIDLIKAALTADALNLGPHWIYNQSKLKRAFPEGIDSLLDPMSPYHPKKKAGDFTHYGDQLLCMLQVHSLSGGWSHELFVSAWKEIWNDDKSYQDGATKTTLARLNGESDEISLSNDTAGAARALMTIPLMDRSDPQAVIAAVRANCEFTHADPETVDTAQYFARVLLLIESGTVLAEALRQAAEKALPTLQAQTYLDQAIAALEEPDHFKVAADFGLTCHNPEAFPLTLYYLLKFPESPGLALHANALAGGDNSARAIIIAMVLTAANGWDASLDPYYNELNEFQKIQALLKLPEPAPTRRRIEFPNDRGETLSAIIEVPATAPRAYAIFAHCFTCGMSSRAATEITSELARHGIATLRFDFTGIGKSEGNFAETSFLTNTKDLVSAANFLCGQVDFEAPQLLIGHSLGGAAVLAAASEIPSLRAVATIGAPAEPAHVNHLLADKIDEIRADGQAEVLLAGRPFQIGKRFLDDVEDHCQATQIGQLKLDLLILHSPTDDTVSISNAGEIYSHAKHPKSFISLPNTDHLLLKKGAAKHVAQLIATWSDRSLD